MGDHKQMAGRAGKAKERSIWERPKTGAGGIAQIGTGRWNLESPTRAKKGCGGAAG